MDKQTWKGTFNYSHEVIILYRKAHSGRQAKVLMMRQLAKDHGVGYTTVANIFNGDKPNFTVEKEST